MEIFFQSFGITICIILITIILSVNDYFKSNTSRYLLVSYFFVFGLEIVISLIEKVNQADIVLYDYWKFSFTDCFFFLFVIHTIPKVPKYLTYIVILFILSINILYIEEYRGYFRFIDKLYNLFMYSFFLLVTIRLLSNAKNCILNRQLVLGIVINLFIFITVYILEFILLYLEVINYEGTITVQLIFNFIYLVFIVLGIIVFFRYKFLFKLIDSSGTRVNKASFLSIEKEEHDFQNLIALIEREELYTNPKLNLNILAKQSKLNSKYISKLINTYSDSNFNDFINKYRIGRFKEIQSYDKFRNYSIIGLAKESGFSSKSTFYKVFKKFEGITPTEYLSADT